MFQVLLIYSLQKLYGYFLKIEDYDILSFSPESFFHTEKNKIFTYPMKGTINKGRNKKENDEVIEDKGVKVFIDPAAIIYLLGTEMDYKKEKLSSQFVFKNPNETERCGCGESFKV